ncbi:hypothetical protein FHW69_001574 [Luteibacter sp. Sphag1AF]|uniref:hypothetical protein n=1 Tax=Luteibacter sp. Sphag1AF TaxID=2587031 RepID=UPI00160CAB20|nr:hypothetical protein [Luteibacter sp. Sphag1AF]MBB3226973.1 hypothetical protein [Luteibacter sp. Sphag1AF]
MEDSPYLRGSLAAAQSALELALATHPHPETVIQAVSEAMTTYRPDDDLGDVRAFAEGWMAVLVPLLTEQALRDSFYNSPDAVALPRGRRTHH